MSLTIKICGLSTEATLDAALDAGADMVGLNLFPRSPRFVPLERAAALARRARGRTEIVVLTVDMDDAALQAVADVVKPDWVQLHGRETAERTADVRHRFHLRTMKALGIATTADVVAARTYAAAADLLLLDAKPPKGADRPGGHGRPFDWSILSAYDAEVPYLLSGGLNPANVAEAIGATGAPGVDVSSGVETAPGTKDPELIRAFIAAARAGVPVRTPERAAS